MSQVDRIPERLAAVRARIAEAAARAGRSPDQVTLVGVAKRQEAARVAAAVRAGLRDVAENYVQEARFKIPEILEKLCEHPNPPRWHLVGRLQRNKARDAVRLFDVVQTLDRAELGHELERRAAREGRRLDVLIQVDVSGEPQKGGVTPDAAAELLAAASAWPHLRVVGLMAIPAAQEHPEASRPAFTALRELRDRLAREAPDSGVTELSMGMSADFEVAIEEGATLVRVGTAIFGARNA